MFWLIQGLYWRLPYFHTGLTAQRSLVWIWPGHGLWFLFIWPYTATISTVFLKSLDNIPVPQRRQQVTDRWVHHKSVPRAWRWWAWSLDSSWSTEDSGVLVLAWFMWNAAQPVSGVSCLFLLAVLFKTPVTWKYRLKNTIGCRDPVVTKDTAG